MSSDSTGEQAAAPPLVLVVDDHEDSRSVMIMLLETGKFRAVGAAGALEALALIAAEKPAAIITDISMPSIDGWMFIDRLKGDEETSAIPIVVLTAHTGDTSKVKALAGGATFFPKPFLADDLLSEVSYLTYGDRSRDRRKSERS